MASKCYSHNDDTFLYARCVAIINGKDYYGKVKSGKITDLLKNEFEAILYVARDAWAKKHGKPASEFPHVSPVSYETGRVAYASYQNPFMFQVAQAREITDITSGYMSGPFNTTRYVYFQFYYKNKKIRIPTYTARRMHHISCLKEEISQADAFRDILINAQKESIKNLPFE